MNSVTMSTWLQRANKLVSSQLHLIDRDGKKDQLLRHIIVHKIARCKRDIVYILPFTTILGAFLFVHDELMYRFSLTVEGSRRKIANIKWVPLTASSVITSKFFSCEDISVIDCNVKEVQLQPVPFTAS